MSYIKMGSPLVYVEGNSEDYVYWGSKDEGGDRIDYIEDYGSISDSGFIELLFKNWETEAGLFKSHLLKRLAKRLGIKLRGKPLTNKEWHKLFDENLKSFNEKKTRMMTYKKLEKEFDEKVRRLQESCPHKRLTGWIDEWYAVGHSTGRTIKVCKKCNLKVKLRKTECVCLKCGLVQPTCFSPISCVECGGKLQRQFVEVNLVTGKKKIIEVLKG